MPWYSIMVGWYVLFTVAFASVIATVGESDGVAGCVGCISGSQLVTLRCA